MWDVDLAVEEVHRLGKKGCRSISFLETPHVQGFPSFLSGHWDPMMQALCDENMVLSLHIGAGFEVIRRPGGGADRPPDGAGLPDQRHHRPGPAVRPDPARSSPTCKVALSEGGIGWIPFYFDRIDRHFTNQEWLHGGDDFGGKLPSEVFREHILACYITDPSGLLLRDRIGIDIIAWECDYPHTDTTWPESPEFAWKELQDAGCARRGDPQDHLGERLPVLRLGPVRPQPSGRTPRSAPCAAWPRPSGVDDDPHAPRRVEEAERGRRHRRRLSAGAPEPDAPTSSCSGRRRPGSSTRPSRWARSAASATTPPATTRRTGARAPSWAGRRCSWPRRPAAASISGDGLVDLTLVAYEFGAHAAPGPAAADQRRRRRPGPPRHRPRAARAAAGRRGGRARGPTPSRAPHDRLGRPALEVRVDGGRGRARRREAPGRVGGRGRATSSSPAAPATA